MNRQFGWQLGYLRRPLGVLVCLLGLSACGDSPPPQATSTASATGAQPGGLITQVETPEPAAGQADLTWQQYISSYSQGWIPGEQAVKIRFTEAQVGAEALNKPLASGFAIKPDIAAQAMFTAADELTIAPQKRWQAGQIYAITLAAKILPKVPADLAPFTLQVQALQQDYELNVAGLVPGSSKNTMQLSGTIRTSDTADAEAIKASLQVEQGGQGFAIQWQHHPDRQNHDFTVAEIPRLAATSHIDLRYSAAALGVDKAGSHNIEVPALNQFKVTATRTVQRPKQFVEVSFSEPLDRNQNLNGLVRLNGESSVVRIDGSRLQVYPNRAFSGVAKLEIEDTIHSSKRLQLAEKYQAEVTFISELPGVRFASKGNIVPPGKNLSVPFEAININAVWVTAFEVYGDNMQQFIQRNQLQSRYVDNNAGRYLWRKKISLPSVPFDQWQRYDIDLNELMTKHRDGLVNLQLHIDRSTIAYPCPDDSAEVKQEKLQSYDGPNMQDDEQRPDWFYRYYSSNNGYVTYEQRSNPCNPEFFTYYDATNVTDSRYLLVSDIGLIVKKGTDNNLRVTTTGIQSGLPLADTQLQLYNYQHQVIASATSDQQGFALLSPPSPGFYLIAERGQDKGYLRLPRNEALPTSQFDVGGEKIRQGLKGFIYGERDVWRPGDDLFLTFVLQDPDHKIPPNHPVSVDFFDPRGNKVLTAVNAKPEGPLYTFKLTTDDSAPTGNWRAVVRVGGEYFDKILKVETIVPNRLKVEITPAQRPIKITKTPQRTELFAQWLNGATAKGLKADAEIKLAPMNTVFEGWSQFEFDDPASGFQQYTETVFDSALDSQGRAAFDLDLSRVSQAPGKLRATFVTRVFEQSGNFSTSIRTEEVMPFEHWVGLNIPKGDGYHNAISRDQDHPVSLLAIDSDGKPLAKRKLKVSVYSIGWRWWWDQEQEDLANYVRDRNNNLMADAELITDANGRANWQLAKDKYDWGRHLVRVCDQDSGHCAGQEVYLGWSWSNQVNPDSATQLMIGTDKDRYQPGDIAKISIPKLAQGKVLYSLENGSRVLDQQWLELPSGATSFDIPVTAAMAPNVYVNVVLLLPHQQRQADAPIRMYGITPLLVDNPTSHLQPLLQAPSTVRPQSSFEVTVSEQNQQPMSYTLALVDEGLLGITGYQAPDPHGAFYRRESLGVLTWDLFDSVIGAYGANLERLLKIGGGDAAEDKKSSKQRRFPPVVRFLGAFTLAPGEQQTHQISLPQYMGAVRLMVVAADKGAYGKVEQTVTVTQPLTLLATLPRVLGPSEIVALPINVFVNNEQIKTVDISVTTNDLFEVPVSQQQMSFNGPGDQITLLELRVKDRVGMGQVTVKARSGDEVTEQTIAIESRSPNSASTEQAGHMLQPGEVWQPQLQPHGMEGTNQASLIVSRLPTINLDKRLNYLIHYPHGCLEQTTSAIFPQIWLSQLLELSAQQQDDIQNNVIAALQKYRSFQTASGSFTYWPGSSYVNEWSNSYVTHFLVEAKAQGYPVPQTMLDDAVKYLRDLEEQQLGEHQYRRLVNAYRLYVLAAAGSADLANMNRLREALLKNTQSYDDQVARWMLTLAYQSLGLMDVARELMQVRPNSVEPAKFRHYTYGSTLRDSALLLLAYQANQQEVEAWDQAQEVARFLAQDSWFSTHSLAWALLSLSHYSKAMNQNNSQFALLNQAAGEPKDWQAMASVSPVYKQEIDPKVLQQGSMQVRNDGDKPLYVEVSNTGIASAGEEVASNEGLSLAVQFMDMNSKPLDIKSLPQGQDFVAEVTVRADDNRNSYKIEDIAMTLVIPGGWQIRNQRLEGDATPAGLDYQDIRDDRVLSYFSLWQDYYWYYRYNDRNRDQLTVRLILNASFAGKFYLPGWQVKSMYDEDIHAQNQGLWVEVVRDPAL